MTQGSGNLTEKARDLLGGDGLMRLRVNLRRRLIESGQAGERMILRNLSCEERSAVERLFGRPGEYGIHAAVRISDLEEMLAPLGFSGLRDVLERVDGPFVDMRQERGAEKKIWNDLREFSLIRLSDRFCDSEAIDLSFRHGGVKRLCGNDPLRGRSLVIDAERMLDALDGQETDLGAKINRTRQELAARVFGDSHALDADRPLVRFMRAVSGKTEESDADFWGSLGVACLATSSTALILNVRMASGLCAHAVNVCAEMGEPFRLTWRMLRDHPQPAIPDELHICENPAVLEAAADRWGSDSLPVICTEGQPSMTCRAWLRSLAEGGARLRYHGDFDWGGLRIANGLFQDIPTLTPWRYDVHEYGRLTGESHSGFILRGTPVDAVWDPLLRPAMERERKGHHEEWSLADLLDDLKPRK